MKCFHRKISKTILKYHRNYKVIQCKNLKLSYRSTDLIFKTQKYSVLSFSNFLYPLRYFLFDVISGETTLFNCDFIYVQVPRANPNQRESTVRKFTYLTPETEQKGHPKILSKVGIPLALAPFENNTFPFTNSLQYRPPKQIFMKSCFSSVP